MPNRHLPKVRRSESERQSRDPPAELGVNSLRGDRGQRLEPGDDPGVPPDLRRLAFLAATVACFLIALAAGIRAAIAPTIAVIPVLTTTVFGLLALAGIFAFRSR
jgi:hypothetical protein